VTSRIY